jgi:uncharacterized protein (TIGR02646 family)
VRYLDRARVAAPECLADYHHPEHNWDNLGSECKKATRKQLVEMQGIPGVSCAEGSDEHGLLCAYCEGAIRTEGHIEHFRRKNAAHFPELTFEWANLFLACGSKKHCGHFKDGSQSRPYDPKEVIKPDTDNPAHFLFFSVSGDVRPRRDLGEEGVRRAEETIRVFNLDEPGLANRRRRLGLFYAKKYDEHLSLLTELSDEAGDAHLIDELRQQFITEERQATLYEPYSSVIRDMI